MRRGGATSLGVAEGGGAPPTPARLRSACTSRALKSVPSDALKRLASTLCTSARLRRARPRAAAWIFRRAASSAAVSGRSAALWPRNATVRRASSLSTPPLPASAVVRDTVSAARSPRISLTAEACARCVPAEGARRAKSARSRSKRDRATCGAGRRRLRVESEGRGASGSREGLCVARV